MTSISALMRWLTALPLILLSATGCSQLGVYNVLVPHDGGVRLDARDVAYGPDGRQRLDIYVPADSAEPADVVVFVYGGSWNSGSKAEYSFAARAFASRGYVTVLFDYRLVPEHRYPVFVEDGAKALAWVNANIADHGGNPDRLFLAGHSAGAYTALMLALAPEFLAAEGLTPAALSGVAGLSGPYDFLPLDTDATREAFALETDLPATQPVNRVRAASGTPPVFLATGTADDVVLPRHTRTLAARLEEAGETVETKYYAEVTHAGTLLAISRPFRGKAPVIDDIVAFFKRF